MTRQVNVQSNSLLISNRNCMDYEIFNPIQYGLFLKRYSVGALWPPLVTLPFLKVKGQNLVGSGILMCFLQNWH